MIRAVRVASLVTGPRSGAARRAGRAPGALRIAARFVALFAACALQCDTGRAIVDSACEPPCNPSQVCVQGACVGNGELRVTLTWDTPGDLDLYVRTPGGSELSFANPTADGARLDRDDRTLLGPENVFWASTPPPGTYQLCVVAFMVTAPTRFTVTVARPGHPSATFTGERRESVGRASCDAMSPHRVGSFALP